MSYISRFEFHFDLDFHEIQLDEAKQYLQEITSEYASLIFNQKTNVHIHLVEGSLKAYLYVIGAIYIGIGQYGSFRSGIDIMIKDAKILKELITTKIVKDGLDEATIIKSKKLHCTPDKIRRVLLAIERLELGSWNTKSELNKELSKIKTSVQNICHSLSDADAGIFIISINKKYWPPNDRIPDYIERYKLVAREEDIRRHSVDKINPLINYKN